MYSEKELFTILPSAARTAALNSDVFINFRHRGLRVNVTVTAIVASPTLTFTIQGKAFDADQYYTLLVSAAIAAAAGVTTSHVIYPGAVAVANLVANLPLPVHWRVSVAVGDTDSATYSVTGEYIP